MAYIVKNSFKKLCYERDGQEFGGWMQRESLEFFWLQLLMFIMVILEHTGSEETLQRKRNGK